MVLMGQQAIVLCQGECKETPRGPRPYRASHRDDVVTKEIRQSALLRRTLGQVSEARKRAEIGGSRSHPYERRSLAMRAEQRGGGRRQRIEETWTGRRAGF